MTDEMFDSSIRSAGDLAGIFEYDGETGYFYLYDSVGSSNQRVMGAIRIVAGEVRFAQTDLAIRWNSEETKVGLFIDSNLWAAFDVLTGAKYGGDYQKGSRPSIPPEISHAFQRS
jgi:hypothetical protein